MKIWRDPRYKRFPVHSLFTHTRHTLARSSSLMSEGRATAARISMESVIVLQSPTKAPRATPGKMYLGRGEREE